MGSWLLSLSEYGLVLNKRSFLLNKSRVKGPLHPFHVSMMDFPTKARTYTKWFMPKIANFTIDHQSLSGIDDIIFTVTWHEVDESTLTLIYLAKKKKVVWENASHVGSWKNEGQLHFGTKEQVQYQFLH